VLTRLIPDSRLHVYHGGHLGILTESDELAPVIERFLSAASPPGRPSQPSRPIQPGRPAPTAQEPT
jgi:hypothetical protein